jgi:hypothetical protein
LRIDIPEPLADQIQNNTPEVRKKVIDPAPEDLPEGYVAWAFAGESELLGDGTIELAWEDEKELKELEIGKNVKLQVPYLKPMNADRAWGQIVLTKVETIDVQESGKSVTLRPIDSREVLMPGADVSDAARVFEFHDDWKLTVVATRYQLEDVKRTSIERALVRMVVTRSEQVAVQALYQVRSARQRLEVKLPKGVKFDTKPASINGKVVSLQTEGETYFVPLVGLDADKSFLLELSYTFPGNAAELPIPIFPQKPAVQKVYVCVYLPDELALLGKSEHWSDEFDWRLDPALNFKPVPRNGRNEEKAVDNLVAWVTEGAAAKGNPLGSFPTDGWMYVFSARSPALEGTLCLKTADENWLHAAVFALVVLGGLLLLPVRTGGRALAIGSGIVAVVLVGVFCPIFSRQILNGTLALAIFIVLVIWSVLFLMRLSASISPLKVSLRKRLDGISQRRPEKAVPADVIEETQSADEPRQAPPAGQEQSDEKKDKEEGGENDA